MALKLTHANPKTKVTKTDGAKLKIKPAPSFSC